MSLRQPHRGDHVRIVSGQLAGHEGTVTDEDGEAALGLEGMMRVTIPGQIPPAWWIASTNLVLVP